MPNDQKPPPSPEPSADPFQALRAQCASFEDGWDGAMAEHLHSLVEALERAYRFAADVQEGAEGHDSTALAAVFQQVQEHLLAATDEVGRACAVLAVWRDTGTAPRTL